MEREKLTINYLLLFFIGLSLIVQVFILNKHSTIGDQLALVNDKIDEIATENNRISRKVASLSAMTTIAQRAKEYGLVSSSQVLSLATSVPLAANLKLSL